MMEDNQKEVAAVPGAQTLTLFGSCSDKRCHEVTWQQVYELIGSAELRTKTEAVRSLLAGMEGLEGDALRSREREVKRMKSSWFPALMAACHCEGGQRRLEHVTQYTGFAHVDFDHLTTEEVADIRARLSEVPEVMLMHTSMSGHGLHVYYRLSPAPEPGSGRAYQDTYVQGFRQGNAYFARLAGKPYDTALEPPVHLSCPCWDEAALFRPDAEPFCIDMEHPLAKNGEAAAPAKGARRRKRKRQTADEATRAELIAAFLKEQPLRYDVLSRKTQVKDADGRWVELTERRTNDLFVACNQALGRNVPMADFRPVLHSGIVPEVNPLREWIGALPPWDGHTDYIAQVAAQVTVDGDAALWEQCFRKWLCAMVAGWMRDGAANHEVLVLLGEQGIYKTTWLDALMPPELADYRCRQAGVRAMDKDEQLRATEFGLINLDEIDRMNEQELNALKSLLTATDVNVRAAYAYGKERRLRVASYVASGNKEQFLTDLTGNRRWLPFRVKAIASPFDGPLPYEGLYAQAWALVQQGFDFWFSTDDIRHIARHVDAFTVESNEKQLLPVYFTPCQPGTPGAQLLTAAEISAKLVTWGVIRHPLDVRQLGTLLRKMGYASKRKGASGARYYYVLEKSADTVNAERRTEAQS